MRRKLRYSRESRRDLDEIWDYIVSELQNPIAAERVVNSVLDAADQLADFAEMGTPLAAVTDTGSDYRFLVCGNYLIFYRVYGAEVYIDRVLYGRRDYLRILFEEPSESE